MITRTATFECSTTFSGEGIPLIWNIGIWYFDIPGLGRWYIDWGNNETINSYQSTSVIGLAVVNVFYNWSQTIYKVTLSVYGCLSNGNINETVVDNVILTNVRPAGTNINSGLRQCGFPAGSTLSFKSENTENRSRLPLIINSSDFSEAAQRLAYAITYEDRVGSSAVTMLNGDEYPDVLARRPVITWPLNMLWSNELSALYRAIGDGNSYVPVQYYDTVLDGDAKNYFRGSIGPQIPGMINDRGLAFQSGTVLTLRAR